MIFEGPSGRMGAPENAEEFVRFEADDITVYVSRQLLKEKMEPGTKEMLFYVDGYGRQSLVFSAPREDAEGGEV